MSKNKEKPPAADPYEELAKAIIVQAAADYREALKVLKEDPTRLKGQRLRSDCERFFLSGWFEELTAVDGSVILCKLKSEEGIHDD